jgi:hypothetical protein
VLSHPLCQYSPVLLFRANSRTRCDRQHFSRQADNEEIGKFPLVSMDLSATVQKKFPAKKFLDSGG